MLKLPQNKDRFFLKFIFFKAVPVCSFGPNKEMFPLVGSSHDLVLHEAVIMLTHSIKDDSSIPLVYFLPL